MAALAEASGSVDLGVHVRRARRLRRAAVPARGLRGDHPRRPASASSRACAPSRRPMTARAAPVAPPTSRKRAGRSAIRPSPAPPATPALDALLARMRREFPGAAARHARGRLAARRRFPGPRLRRANISTLLGGILERDERGGRALRADHRGRAKYLAVAMAYDDVIRVADLKTRASALRARARRGRRRGRTRSSTPPNSCIRAWRRSRARCPPARPLASRAARPCSVRSTASSIAAGACRPTRCAGSCRSISWPA